MAATTTLDPTMVVKNLQQLDYEEALVIQRRTHEQVSALRASIRIILRPSGAIVMRSP